jgi:hypothetical protein
MNNVCPPTFVTSRMILAEAGKWHRTNMQPRTASEQTVVIAGGVVTPPIAYPLLVIDTEAAGAADDIDTLAAGMFFGQEAVFRSTTNARVPTWKDGTGNVQTEADADKALDSTRDLVKLTWDLTTWNQSGFSNNG